MPMLWSSKDDDRLVDEVRQGKDIRFRLTEETREKIRSYCVANVAVMEKWRDKYANARNNDASLPNVPSQSWILDAMLTAKSNGEVVSTEEMDYAYGCDWHAYKVSAIWSRGRHFHVQHTDINRNTYDSGVSATFDQETTAGSEVIEKFTYYGHIDQILGIGFRSFDIHILDVKCLVKNLIQVFYYPMHGDTNWKYVIDVAPRATRVLQSTQELSTIDDVNRILDDNDDDTSEEGGSFSDAKLEYSSTSTDGSASEPENSFLNAFELDTNTDEIDTFSHSSIRLNLEIVLEIDHEDLYADITSVL
ncbi:hypothetical protein L7F22_004887 [Adiantum nelumboides]|nr:hypothetical protein [Adiantum nelumboides]